MLTRRDRDETLDDVLHGVFLEDKADRTEIQRAVKNSFLFVHRENRPRPPGASLAETTDGRPRLIL